MKFRTEITPSPLPRRLDYHSHVLCIGSCFAQHIGGRLEALKFSAAVNPTGILFNPASVADALLSYATERTYAASDLHGGSDGRWFSFDFHSAFSADTQEAALRHMQAGLQRGSEALKAADTVLVTLGTAWVYALSDGHVVANCHKQPQSLFVRRRLSVDEIVERWDTLLDGLLRDKQVIFSVSPVRHLGDGAEQNSVSKAVLRLAADALCYRHENAYYFPAYELLMDDLRDYRFYAADLAHPSDEAVQYVWEKFAEAALTPQAVATAARVARITAAAAHRPFCASSAEYRTFCRRQLAEIAALAEVDFSKEQAFFEPYCK